MLAPGMTVLAVIVAALTAWLVGRSGRTAAVTAVLVIAAMMTLEYLIAASGVLREWDRRPPPLMLALWPPILLALVTALAPVGRRIAAASSFAAIIGIQAFRLPLELLMHRAATTGVMPVQMSYSGWNFDIVTGALAIPVALLALRPHPPRGLIAAWNLIGTLLLINIVAVAIAATPIFAAFGPDALNTWVADPPFVWLPTVLVPAAVFGHALTWRRLLLNEPTQAARG